MQVEPFVRKEAPRFAKRKLMFGRFKRLHFVGIGGAGMSGLGEILHNLGFTVTGSDNTPSEITRYLSGLGIGIQGEHVGNNVLDTDVVVISSAVSADNPEVLAARERGIPVIKRAEMLGELMRLKFSIGVAGTHGKTTTTSMVGRILQTAGLDPTLVVGGIVSELGTGASLGQGDYLVAEADEYDRSIYAMYPSIAVVLNIESDHMDCYSGLEDLKQAFLEYMNRVPFYGSAILSADDPNVRKLLTEVTRPHTTFGFSAEADFRAVNIEATEWGSSFAVYRHEELLGQVNLGVPGRHNVSNALAAIATCMELEVPFTKIGESLAGFTGVGRRFELIGQVNDVIVIDDYAHHPTEIEATIATARQTYRRRLITVFQPHLYSRTRQFLTEFATVLAKSDWCVLTDIYPAREEPIPGLSSESIKEEALRLGFKNFSYVGTKEHALPELKKLVQPGDVVMTVGAGSITHIRGMILEMLHEL